MRSGRDSQLRRTVARFARSHGGTALATGWAFAEAVSWPLLPEVALAALCVADPPSGPRLSAAAAAGSVAGGGATYALASHGVVPPRPLTTLRMRHTVTGQLAAEGAGGVRHQPLAGIPFKVYAGEAGMRRLGAAPFLTASARARGARILTVGLALSALGAAANSQRHRYPYYLLAVGGGFTAGLATVVRRWR